MVGAIMWSRINTRTVMPAYEDKRDGRWRYRKRVDLPDGRRIRVTGTPATDTKKAAEAAERAHIDRVLHPERARAQAAAVPERKETTTFREFAKRFMAGYLPGQKPSERKAKNQILNTHPDPVLRAHGARRDPAGGCRRVHDRGAEAVRAQDGEQPAGGVLSTLLGYAVENKVIANVTLRCHVRGRKAEDAPILAVEADDVQKLLGAADVTYRAAILLATEAGFRVGEIRGVQWTDVRGDEVTIRRGDRQRRQRGGSQARPRAKGAAIARALDGASRTPQARTVGAVRDRRRAAAVPGDARYAAPDLTSVLAWRCRSRRTARRCRGTRSGIRSARSARSAGCRSRRFGTSWATRTSRRRFATSP